MLYPRRPDDTPQLAVPVTSTDHAQGPGGVPVTLVEYGDYECASCGQAYPVVKAVQRALGGRLRFVFRNFPLRGVHPHAEHAAEAAEAAGVQGGEPAFWAMHDTLYAHQRALTDADLAEYVDDLGLAVDVSRLTREVAEGAYAAQIKAQAAGGVRSGVNGTPTFFINDARFDGDWTDAAALTAALNAAALNAAATARLTR